MNENRNLENVKVGDTIMVYSGGWNSYTKMVKVTGTTAKYVKADGGMYAKDGGDCRGDSGFAYIPTEEDIKAYKLKQERAKLVNIIRRFADNTYSIKVPTEVLRKVVSDIPEDLR